jgi:Ca2+-binding EF-hand superfamily protein
MGMDISINRNLRSCCNVDLWGIVEFNFTMENAEEVDDILKSCDKNGDGKIDFGEFVSAMVG